MTSRATLSNDSRLTTHDSRLTTHDCYNVPHMKKSAVCLVIISASVMILGAGCNKKAPAASTASPRSPSVSISDSSSTMSQIPAPADPWKEYADAAPLANGLHAYAFNRTDGNVSISIPASWSQEGAVWHPDAGKIDHVRIAHFSDEGPIPAWQSQQALSAHVVMHAESADGKYFLMVNHPTLQASILKVFIPDPKLPENAYYFFECRAAYASSERAALWSACKAALQSLKIQS